MKSQSVRFSSRTFPNLQSSPLELAYRRVERPDRGLGRRALARCEIVRALSHTAAQHAFDRPAAHCARKFRELVDKGSAGKSSGVYPAFLFRSRMPSTNPTLWCCEFPLV